MTVTKNADFVKVKGRILKNKPLVEAIFELRWELQVPQPGMRIDPHYKVLIGRVYDRVSEEYPFHEQLPTAIMPDEIAAYILQHRFRKDKDKWPLVQLGPGVITLNETEGYIWEDFEKRIVTLLDALFEAYPDAEKNFKVSGLVLRYIDAVDFNYEKDNMFSFLKEKMKYNIQIYEKLFEGTGVSKLPLGFDLRFSFPSSKPKGAMHLKFARGKKKESDALIWETMVQSIGDDAPQAKSEIAAWVRESHSLTDDWFFKIIQGDLLKRFE
jgi:uncharacterized protein (TIGR04255 family)